MNKKTSIYPQAEQCLLEKNIVYTHFREDFNIIVDKFNDFNQHFNITTDEDGNITGLSTKDYSFFKEFYTLSNKIETKDTKREKSFPDISLDEIGAIEWELISFCSGFQSSSVNSRLKFVIGNVGEGKSTLINYVLKYLFQEKHSLKNSLLPIIINCQGYLSKINSENKKGISINDFVDNLVKNVFYDKMRFHITISNDEFWDWYEKNITSKYRQEIIDLRAFSFDKLKLKREILSLRKSEKNENEDFFIHTMSYAIQKLKKQIVIVFDNVDPFDIEKVVEFYWKAKNYINQSPIKIIITVRKDTFRKLKLKINDTASLSPITINTNLENILKRRCTKILEKVEFSNQKRPLVFTSGNTTYNKNINPISHLSFIIQGLLDDYTINCISKFAKKNIRNELELLRIIFESGFLPNSILSKSLFKSDGDESSFIVPPEFILSSILTFGYGTYFTSVSKKLKIPGVINILSNSYHNNPIQIFSKLYILNYLQKKGFKDEQKKTNIIDVYAKCVKNMNDSSEYIEGFKNSLYRLFNAGLITSPDIDFAESQEEFENYVSDIRISSLGDFYFDFLLKSPFYLMFMKDDVYLENVNSFEDAYFVSKKYPKDRYFWTNFKNLILFLKEYGELELKAINSFLSYNTFDVFNSNFNSENENLFSLTILNSLTDFVNNKNQLTIFAISFFDNYQVCNAGDITELDKVISHLQKSYKEIIK